MKVCKLKNSYIEFFFLYLNYDKIIIGDMFVNMDEIGNDTVFIFLFVLFVLMYISSKLGFFKKNDQKKAIELNHVIDARLDSRTIETERYDDYYGEGKHKHERYHLANYKYSVDGKTYLKKNLRFNKLPPLNITLYYVKDPSKAFTLNENTDGCFIRLLKFIIYLSFYVVSIYISFKFTGVII